MNTPNQPTGRRTLIENAPLTKHIINSDDVNIFIHGIILVDTSVSTLIEINAITIVTNNSILRRFLDIFTCSFIPVHLNRGLGVNVDPRRELLGRLAPTA